MLPPRPRLKQCFLINFFSNQFSFIVLKMATNCAFHGCVSQHKNNAKSTQKYHSISFQKFNLYERLGCNWSSEHAKLMIHLSNFWKLTPSEYALIISFPITISSKEMQKEVSVLNLIISYLVVFQKACV